MDEEELSKLLVEYASAYNNDQNWEALDAQFPQLKDFDADVLHEYAVTYNNPEYNKDLSIINPKFEHDLFADVKKKDELGVAVPAPASSPSVGTDPSSVSPLPTEPSTGSLESEKPKGEYNIDPFSFSMAYQLGGMQELDDVLTPYMNLMVNEEYEKVSMHMQQGMQQVPLMDVVDNIARDIAGNENLLSALGIDPGEARPIHSFIPRGNAYDLSPEDPKLYEHLPQEELLATRQREVSKLLNRKVYEKLGQTIMDALPMEARQDEVVLKGIEQQLLEDYGAYIDLSGEGEVGNTPFLKFEGWNYGQGQSDIAAFGLPLPEFSGYLADQWNAGTLDLINAFAYAVNGFESTPEIFETREAAEKLRRETLQFIDGMTEGDFTNFTRQMLGQFAAAGPQMTVVLPAGIATGGLGFGTLTTSAMIGFESAAVATTVEAARIADNPEWNLYIRNGKSHTYQEAMQLVQGDVTALAEQFTVDDNSSGKVGYLANVFGTSFVADGASTFGFMRALRNVPTASLANGARDLSNWWRYHAINLGLSIPVGGTTGSLTAMQQFMAAREAQGLTYTWSEVREVGIDAGLSGATFATGMSVSGSMLNRAVARDPVGHGGASMRFALEENILLGELSRATTNSQKNALNLQYQNLLRRRNKQMLRDEDYYSLMSDSDLQRVYEISLEQNRLYRDMMRAPEGSDELKSMAQRFDDLQQSRLDIESVYDAQRPYAEEFLFTEGVDGTPVRLIAPLILGEDPNSADYTLLRSRPEGSSYVRFDAPKRGAATEGFIDMFQMIRETQDLVQRARPEGAEGRRVSEEADIDVKLALMEPRMAIRIKDAINERRQSGLYKRLSEANKLIKGRETELQGLLPEGVTADNISLFDMYLTALHVPERNRHITRQNQEEAARLRQKSNLTPEEKLRLSQLEDYISANKGSGMSDAEAAAFLEGLPDDIKAKFDEAIPAVRAMQQRIRDIYLEAGIYSEAQYKASMNTFQHYVPMHGRAIGEEWAAITGTDASGNPIYRKNDFAYTNAPSRIDLDGNLWKAAEGRSEATGNTLGKIIAQEAQAIMLAERNRVNQAVYRFVEQNPIDPKSLVKPGKKGETVTEDPYYRLVGQDENLPDQHTLTVYFDGEARQVYFRDPDVIRQFKNGDKNFGGGFADGLFEFLRRAAVIRKSQTNFAPEFGQPAYIRDMQTGVVQALSMAEREFGYALHAADGSKVNTTKMIAEMQAITPAAYALMAQGEMGFTPGLGSIDTELGRYAAEYKKSGAETGFARVDEMRTLFRELRRETDPKKRTQMFLEKGAMAPLKFVESMNNIFENTTRFAAYAAARRQGVSVDRASALAKYVTVDFNRRGTYASQMNGLVFFFNATVQGGKQAYETIFAKKPEVTEDGRIRSEAERRNDSMGIFGSMVAFGVMMANYNEMVSAVDETGRSEYSKIPDYIKKKNQIIMIPGTGEYVEIPKFYGYGQFMDMGLVLGEIQQGIRSQNDGIFYLATALEHNFSPVPASPRQEDKAKEGLTSQGLASRIGNLVIPDPIFQPIVDYAVNVNFYGGDVYRDKEGRSRVNMNEGEIEAMNQFFIQLNKETGGSKYVSGDNDLPVSVFDYFAESYLGGPYRFYNDLESTVNDWRAIRNLPEDQRPEGLFDVDDIPFVRSFYSDGNRNDVMMEYYAMKAEVKPFSMEKRDVFTMMDAIDTPLPSRFQGGLDDRIALPVLMERFIEPTDALAAKVYRMRAALQQDVKKLGWLATQEEFDEYGRKMRELEDLEMVLMGNMALTLEAYYEFAPPQKYDK